MCSFLPFHSIFIFKISYLISLPEVVDEIHGRELLLKLKAMSCVQCVHNYSQLSYGYFGQDLLEILFGQRRKTVICCHFPMQIMYTHLYACHAKIHHTVIGYRVSEVIGII